MAFFPQTRGHSECGRDGSRKSECSPAEGTGAAITQDFGMSRWLLSNENTPVAGARGQCLFLCRFSEAGKTRLSTH
jgi:hypothetical protein